MIGIYKITSPSNKIYIGQSVNIESRWKHYNWLDCPTQPILYNSLRKYGVENHRFEVIEECGIDQLDEREVYWGNYYNTLNEGLNGKLGEGRGICSEETKHRISERNKGKKRSEATKQKMRKPKPEGFGKKPEGFGEKISKLHKGISKPKGPEYGIMISQLHSKSVQQYTLEGILVNEFNSVKEANECLNKSSHSIGRACRGEVKKAFGYIWKFKTS